MVIKAAKHEHVLTDAQKRKQTLNQTISVALLMVVSACVLFFNLESYPRLWFDEGYKLNAAYTFEHDGIYGSYTVDGYVPFDPGTSSGPSDILLNAFVLKLLGTTIFAARLTSVLSTILIIVCLYQIGCYLWDGVAALFCVLLVIAVPPINQVGLIIMGRQSLSESTALGLMMLGVWILSRAWRTQSSRLSWLSGVVMGLGMLSKSQMAIGLVPALLVVVGWRWVRERKAASHLVAPVIALIIVFMIWMLIGRLLSPQEIREQNNILLLDAIRTDLFTTLFGRNLSGRAFLLIGFMLFGTLTGLWRLGRNKILEERQWIELLLIVFTLFMTIWFALFSVGWVRYTYAGLVVGLFLVARFIWGLLTRILTPKDRLSFGIIGVISVMALGINFYAINRGAVGTDVQDTAHYIATMIPKDAIIETWEWELDMLSGHRQFHHPQQALLFEAIRQNSHHEDFNLRYDALQANPDYLIVGSFGSWTGIYPESVLQKYFTEVATFGIYHVYKRLRTT